MKDIHVFYHGKEYVILHRYYSHYGELKVKEKGSHF
jgi:hypothetical protein